MRTAGAAHAAELLLVSIMDARKLPVRSPVAARAALAQHALRAGRAPYASRRHPLVLVLPPPAAIAALVRPWPLARVRAACAREAGASGRRRNSACQSLSLLEPSLEPPVPFSVPFPLQCATRQKVAHVMSSERQQKHLQNGVGGQGKRRACPTRISVLFWTRPLGDTIALGQFVRLRGLLRALECGTKVVSFAIQHDPCGELAGGGLAHALREVVPATRRTRGSARRVAQSREHPAPTHGNGPGWIGVDKLRSAVAIGNNCRNSRLSTPLSTRTAPSGELTRGGVPLRAKLTGRPRRNRALHS